MYRCDNDSIIPVEYNCSNVAMPVCRRAGEVIISLADDTSCCPQKVCGEAANSQSEHHLIKAENVSAVMMSSLTPQCATRACVTCCPQSANTERSWCRTTDRTPAVRTMCVVSFLSDHRTCHALYL